MNAHENLVLRLFAVIDAEKWGSLPELCAESICYERPGYTPIRGISSLVSFYCRERVVAHGRHDIRGCLGGGNEACCWGQFEGVSRSGRALSEGFADWYWISNGLITRRKTFFYRPAV
ncbi:nuclear transport factor 2 family protein [Streptomyces sp. NPDC047081]|uniref:nuclear transport factor 2 family protein n=1 Tax=Streptomyces sp. NPDC047081 TaxID=3154706 RepID=UPI0033F37A67